MRDIRHHALPADGFSNNSECLLTNLPIWGDVIRAIQVQNVNLIFGYKFVDVDGSLALNRDFDLRCEAFPMRPH
jgi:hypothetical protein